MRCPPLLSRLGLAVLTWCFLAVACAGDSTSGPAGLPADYGVSPVQDSSSIAGELAEPQVGIGSLERLALPTATPDSFVRLLSPTATLSPSPTPIRRLASEGQVLDSTAGCEAAFRASLLEYDPSGVFGAEVVVELEQAFARDKPACVEEGWAPVFSLDRTCMSVHVGGQLLSSGLLLEVSSSSSVAAGPTARDVAGNLLVHFSSMPFEALSGCWFYDAGRQLWAWTLEDGREGYDRVVQSACDGELQRELVGSDEVTAVGVVELMERIRSRYPLDCEASAWSQYPSLVSNPGCFYDGPTGRFGDGSLLVNWHPLHPATDGSVCWYWNREESRWLLFYDPR